MADLLQRFQAALADRYAIERELGHGGMAVVYLARDLKHDRPLALKLLRPEVAAALGAERFLREIKLAAGLAHPHILPVYDSGEADGLLYYVMPYLEGESLRDRLTRQARLPLEQAVQIAREMADALAYAHDHRVVHRDIKPENLLFEAGHAVVTDFGIARPATAPGAERLTQTGFALGTPAYMSPEQSFGEDVGPPADVFSLGIVLYEMATGRHPFLEEALGWGDAVHAIRSQAALAPSRLNPEISSALEALILQMLEKEPGLRPTAAGACAALSRLGETAAPAEKAPPVPRPARHTVGRDEELAQLRAAWESAAAGRGLLVCVAGEPGIGKTTLVEEFFAELAASSGAPGIARGRCSERLAGTEAYLPFLEALDSLLHGKAGESAARTMRLIAPTWYAQLAPLAVEADRGAASQERMKRELSNFLHELARLRPLVVFFDDLHWADVSTVDLLAYIAARMESTRLLVIATYRETELRLARHPFLPVKLDLQARGICREIPLGFLGREDIERYLTLVYPQHRFPPAFPALIHVKTEGSPLFMVGLLRYLRDRRVIVEEEDRWTLGRSVPEIERDLPPSVRGMIQKKIDQLAEDHHRLLALASVQGYEFDSAVLAKALARDPAEVEERLQDLDRVHAFVRLVGERQFPDGTPTVGYRFVHVLYQNALYAALTPTRKASLSAAVAETLLAYYGEQSAAVASEVALLLEAARDFARAAGYFLVAAQDAARIFAYQEAVLLARRGLDLVKTLPDTPERAQQEIMLQITLGGLLIVTLGAGAPDVERAYARARELCRQVGDSPQLFTALRGLSEFYHTRAELETARDLAQEALEVAERLGDRALIVDAHHAVAMPLLYLGQLVRAREHLAQGLALYDPEQRRVYAALYQAIDPGVGCHYQSGRVLWLLGYPDRALEVAREGIALAQKLTHPYSLAHMKVSAAMVHQFRREPRGTREQAEAVIALAHEHGLPEVLAWATFWRGWALAELGERAEGIGQMREGMALYGAHEAIRPHQLALLGEALAKHGEADQGLAALAEALAAARIGGRYYLAELYRLRGELLLLADPSKHDEVEACFGQAVEIARRQSAKSLELRAVASLSRLWQKRGRREEASRSLAAVYRGFTEGFDTADLQEARTLLA